MVLTVPLELEENNHHDDLLRDHWKNRHFCTLQKSDDHTRNYPETVDYVMKTGSEQYNLLDEIQVASEIDYFSDDLIPSSIAKR